MKAQDKKILIFGLGSDILKDDGIGIHLINDLKQYFQDPVFHFETALLSSIELLEVILPYDQVIFIDGMKTGRYAAGEVKKFTLDDFEETLHLTNVHDASFVKLIELGHTLNKEMTHDISVIAVEILEPYAFGEELSGDLNQKYPAILKTVHDLVMNEVSHSFAREALETNSYGVLN